MSALRLAALEQWEAEARFWPKVRKGPGCWEWTASRNRWGYGRLGVTRRQFAYAHRIAWELENGPIPTGKIVCHRCDNPACVRPDHLFLGTHADNVQDMLSKGRGGLRLHPETAARGEQASKAKLKAEQVKEIRRLYRGGGISQRELARRFGVTQNAISMLLHRKSWSHVQDE